MPKSKPYRWINEVFGIVPFSSGKATINDCLLMLELINLLGSASVEESGFEGLDLGFQWSELLSECHHLVNDIAGRSRRPRPRIHDAPRYFAAHHDTSEASFWSGTDHSEVYRAPTGFVWWMDGPSAIALV